MTLPEFQTLALVAGALVTGTAAGWLHFASLARIADMILAGHLRAIALQLLRILLLAAFLWLCTRGGPAVLFAGAAGVLAGRALVMRRAR